MGMQPQAGAGGPKPCSAPGRRGANASQAMLRALKGRARGPLARVLLLAMLVAAYKLQPRSPTRTRPPNPAALHASLRSAVEGFKSRIEGPQRGELEAFWRRRLQDLPGRGIAVAAGAVSLGFAVVAHCMPAWRACLLPGLPNLSNSTRCASLWHNGIRC